jgi:hypothetical protein
MVRCSLAIYIILSRIGYIVTVNKHVLHIHVYASYFVIFSLWKRMGRFIL